MYEEVHVILLFVKWLNITKCYFCFLSTRHFEISFLIFFPEKKDLTFDISIVSNLHEMSDPVFLEKIEKVINLSPAEL